MKIKWRNFKGLLTNIDASDKGVEYFSKFKDIKIYPGYIKSQGLKFTEQTYELPSDYTFVTQQYVFLDEDRKQNQFNEVAGASELIPNYVQNIQKYKFRIISKELAAEFSIIYSIELLIDNIWTVIGTHTKTALIKELPGKELPLIYNEEGILKIFFKDESYWLGKINHGYWYVDPFGFEPVIKYKAIESKFYLQPLFIPYLNLANTLRIAPLIQESIIDDDKNKIDSYTSSQYIFPDNYSIEGLRGVTSTKINYFNSDGDPINFPAIDGAMHILLNFNPNYLMGSFIWFKNIEGIHNTKFEEGGFSWVEDLNINGTVLPGSSLWFNDAAVLQNFIDGFIGQSYLPNITFSDNAFDNTTDIEFEFVTTVIIDKGEYVIGRQMYHSKEIERFFLEVVPMSTDLIFNLLNLRIEKFNFYVRYASDISSLINKDFEYFGTINLLSGKQVDINPKLTISKLTPNGIFLTQMIGKFFDPVTYRIITAPDDYVNVAGVPYVLKGSNVYYPAVGGGNILNNFYYENVIPGIEGKLLAAFGSLLGIFSANKELMTLVDFSPVESSMIFYIKDTLQYKIRDRKDIIETAEGVFIHLKEGIYITNGRERTLISEPINDLVRIYYDTSNIFFNSYWKQLYYYTGSRLFCFDFETQSWTEYTLLTELDEIIDFIEDFESKMYFISKDKLYELEFEDKEGELELSYMDLQEYSISKRINYLAADHIGDIEAADIAGSTGTERAVRYLFNKLDNRKPVKNISVGIKFNGFLYGIEMDIETISTDQL